MSSDSDDQPQERHSRPLPAGEPASSNGNQLAAIIHDGVAVEGGADGTISPTEPAELKEKKEEPVTWASLPRRSQLIILTLARLSEPLVQTSLQVRRYSIDKEFLGGYVLIYSANRHICSTNSNPSMRASPTLLSLHRLDLWRVVLRGHNF